MEANSFNMLQYENSQMSFGDWRDEWLDSFDHVSNNLYTSYFDFNEVAESVHEISFECQPLYLSGLHKINSQAQPQEISQKHEKMFKVQKVARKINSCTQVYKALECHKKSEDGSEISSLLEMVTSYKAPSESTSCRRDVINKWILRAFRKFFKEFGRHTLPKECFKAKSVDEFNRVVGNMLNNESSTMSSSSTKVSSSLNDDTYESTYNTQRSQAPHKSPNSPSR